MCSQVLIKPLNCKDNDDTNILHGLEVEGLDNL
jgi:hypothetical protein